MKAWMMRKNEVLAEQNKDEIIRKMISRLDAIEKEQKEIARKLEDLREWMKSVDPVISRVIVW